jgi:hypothetical protein
MWNQEVSAAADMATRLSGFFALSSIGYSV